MIRKKNITAVLLAFLIALSFAGCAQAKTADALPKQITLEAETSKETADARTPEKNAPEIASTDTQAAAILEWNNIQLPAWDGKNAWDEINGNMPLFGMEDAAAETMIADIEEYAELDSLGRCGQAFANVSLSVMPTEERGEIGSVKPSGWHTVKYNGLINGNYLYNRCHLIGYQLAGENANEKNLITGTRYLNIEGMLPFENAVADYVQKNNAHVFYRVTPIFYENELVARGVVMEAWSVEDDSVRFCVYAHNVQPGVEIDYATGESRRLDGRDEYGNKKEEPSNFVLNTSSGKFHKPGCEYAKKISKKNYCELNETLSTMKNAGYEPCGACRPDEDP